MKNIKLNLVKGTTNKDSAAMEIDANILMMSSEIQEKVSILNTLKIFTSKQEFHYKKIHVSIEYNPNFFYYFFFFFICK